MLCDVQSIARFRTINDLKVEVGVGMAPSMLGLACSEASITLRLSDVRLDLAVQIGPLVDYAFWGNKIFRYPEPAIEDETRRDSTAYDEPPRASTPRPRKIARRDRRPTTAVVIVPGVSGGGEVGVVVPAVRPSLLPRCYTFRRSLAEARNRLE